MAVIQFPPERTARNKAARVNEIIEKLVRDMRVDLAFDHLEFVSWRATRRARKPTGFKRDQIRPAP